MRDMARLRATLDLYMSGRKGPFYASDVSRCSSSACCTQARGRGSMLRGSTTAIECIFPVTRDRPLRIMCIISIPAMVVAADQKLLKPSIGVVIRLIVGRSCSVVQSQMTKADLLAGSSPRSTNSVGWASRPAARRRAYDLKRRRHDACCAGLKAPWSIRKDKMNRHRPRAMSILMSRIATSQLRGLAG